MKTSKKAQLTRRIVRKARCIVRECDQALRDYEYYNSRHVGEQGLDVRDFRLMRESAMSVLVQIGAKP